MPTTPEHDHAVVEHPDAPATLLEREPVRSLATAPLAVLSIAGAITALGVDQPVVAIALAVGIIVAVTLLELVRARVSPAPAPAPDDV